MRRTLTLALLLSLAATSCAWIARASVDSNGIEANGGSSSPTLSNGGQYVAFRSSASNLVPGDVNGQSDLFRRDNATGAVTRFTDTPDVRKNPMSPKISTDGRYVAYVWLVQDPTTFALASDILRYDAVTGSTEQLNVDGNGNPSSVPTAFSLTSAMSGDGRYVAFDSDAPDLVPGDTNGTYDLFVRDTQAGTTTLVSVDSNGNQANGGSSNPSLSADGRYIAFRSLATNLVPGDTNGSGDIFVRDTVAGTTIRVSVDGNGNQGTGGSILPSISADGRYVAFGYTADDLVAGDTNGVADVFVRDTVAGTTTRVSVGPNGQQGNFASASPSISADGTRIAFTTPSTWFGLPIRTYAYVHDTTTDTTTPVSKDSLGNPADANSSGPSISPDGRFVAFATDATNLVANDTNAARDVIVRAIATSAIDAVIPDTLATGTTTDVTITGSGFGPGTTITDPAGVTVDSVSVVSDTELSATVTVDPAASSGPRNLSIQVPGPGPGSGGLTSSVGVCPDCLAISP